MLFAASKAGKRQCLASAGASGSSDLGHAPALGDANFLPPISEPGSSTDAPTPATPEGARTIARRRLDGHTASPISPLHKRALALESDRMMSKRLMALAQAALSQHTPGKPPTDELALWLHEAKVELIVEYAKVTRDDPRFKVMYRHPIQALILISQLCTNWWCGPAAIAVVEMLGARFNDVRGDALTDPRTYELALRDMTEGVMRAFRHRASLYHHKLEPDNVKVTKLITKALKGLRAQGVPPIDPSPAAPPCPVKCGPDHAVCTPRAERITKEEHLYFIDVAGIPEVIRRINVVVDHLGGLKMGELVKWWLHGRNRPQWDYAKLDFATLDKLDDSRNALDRVKGATPDDLMVARCLFGQGYARARMPTPALCECQPAPHPALRAQDAHGRHQEERPQVRQLHMGGRVQGLG